MFWNKEKTETGEMKNFFWYRPIAPVFFCIWGIALCLIGLFGVIVGIVLENLFWGEISAEVVIKPLVCIVLGVLSFSVGGYHRRANDKPRIIDRVIAYIGTYVLTILLISLGAVARLYWNDSGEEVHIILTMIETILIYFAAIAAASQYGIVAAVMVGAANYTVVLFVSVMEYMAGFAQWEIMPEEFLLAFLPSFLYVAIPYIFAGSGEKKLFVALGVSSLVSSVVVLLQQWYVADAWIIVPWLCHLIALLIVSEVFFIFCRFVKKGQGKMNEKIEESASKIPVAENDWICSCGKRNPAYTSTCVCGKNKRDITLKK